MSTSSNRFLISRSSSLALYSSGLTSASASGVGRRQGDVQIEQILHLASAYLDAVDVSEGTRCLREAERHAETVVSYECNDVQPELALGQDAHRHGLGFEVAPAQRTLGVRAGVDVVVHADAVAYESDVALTVPEELTRPAATGALHRVGSKLDVAEGRGVLWLAHEPLPVPPPSVE